MPRQHCPQLCPWPGPPRRARRVQTLFQDEAGGQSGLGSAAGEIVDGAVHRRVADVAAGEEQRVDDVGVGGQTIRPAPVSSTAESSDGPPDEPNAGGKRFSMSSSERMPPPRITHDDPAWSRAAAWDKPVRRVRVAVLIPESLRSCLRVEHWRRTPTPAAGTGSDRAPPSLETMVALNGVRGVQAVPKAGHSFGFDQTLRHLAGVAQVGLLRSAAPTPNFVRRRTRRSAASVHPDCGIIPIPATAGPVTARRRSLLLGRSVSGRGDRRG